MSKRVPTVLPINNYIAILPESAIDFLWFPSWCCSLTGLQWICTRVFLEAQIELPWISNRLPSDSQMDFARLREGLQAGSHRDSSRTSNLFLRFSTCYSRRFASNIFKSCHLLSDGCPTDLKNISSGISLVVRWVSNRNRMQSPKTFSVDAPLHSYMWFLKDLGMCFPLSSN